MKIGIVQMQSGDDPWLNLWVVQNFVEEAVAKGCELVCFPENVFYRGPRKTAFHKREDTYLELKDHKIVANSAFSKAVADFVSAWPIAVSLGSVLQKSAMPHLPPPFHENPHNSHWMVHAGGYVEAYHKIHLFNFDSNVGSYNESSDVVPGTQPLSVLCGQYRIGLSICYDLRFPELYRVLTLKHKTEVLLVPAAFTKKTGEAHWHSLLRARAIENLSYVIAPAQWGTHLDSKGQTLYCYGHSLAYDPWGNTLVEAPAEGDCLLTVEVSKSPLLEVRSSLPALQSASLFQGMFLSSST
jgi:deaminated glutathione amidase